MQRRSQKESDGEIVRAGRWERREGRWRRVGRDPWWEVERNKKVKGKRKTERQTGGHRGKAHPPTEH